MAKDGTNRGGARVGAGRKPKPLAEKLLDGNPGGRQLKIVDMNKPANLHGVDMPDPSELLSAEQRDGGTLQAEEIYKKTWQWIAERGCAQLILPQLLERYAMAAARWIQCEEAISKYGFLGKHPTCNTPIISPFVSMSQIYTNQTNRLWMEIYSVVSANCSTEFNAGNNPQDDVMERLLSVRRDRK